MDHGKPPYAFWGPSSVESTKTAGGSHVPLLLPFLLEVQYPAPEAARPAG